MFYTIALYFWFHMQCGQKKTSLKWYFFKISFLCTFSYILVVPVSSSKKGFNQNGIVHTQNAIMRQKSMSENFFFFFSCAFSYILRPGSHRASASSATQIPLKADAEMGREPNLCLTVTLDYWRSALGVNSIIDTIVNQTVLGWTDTMVLYSPHRREISGSMPSWATRDGSRDCFVQVTKECRWWWIHHDFETRGQSYPKSETECTNGPTKWTLVQQKRFF